MIKALAGTAYALSMLRSIQLYCSESLLIVTNNWHLVLYKVEMSRTWVLVLNAYLYWTNKFIHGFINIYFNSIVTSYIRNPCSILKEYRRNFGHGFGLKKCSVYKLDYQLEIDHFLVTKKWQGYPLRKVFLLWPFFEREKIALRNAFLII